jgi:hypothetical protein
MLERKEDGAMLCTVTLLVAMNTTGGIFFHRDPNNHVLPPLPGYGAGFANGNPDGYGWFDQGTYLPMVQDRTSEYHFPRYMAVPATQLWLPNYYNPYVSRGQRYMPYAGCGGPHAMSGPPEGSAMESVHPYTETLNNTPRVTPPRFNGRVEAAPDNRSSTGLRP